MALPHQTIALLKSARQLVMEMPADAVLLLTETDLDWDAVQEHLEGCRLLVAAQDGFVTQKLKDRAGLIVLEIDPGPTPIQERMSLALLNAVASEKLHTGADVVALYNGIEAEEGNPEHIDSLSVIHLGEHLERLSAQELRKLDMAEAACMYIDVLAEGITLSKGLGSRHWAAAAISQKTNAIAVAVSQSSGAVRIFQDGEVVLRIEPLARPLIWRHFEMEAKEGDGIKTPVG